MTDEEKKAIKGLEWSQQQMRLGNLPDYNQGHYADIRIVLNLIEKQSKEIEKYKMVIDNREFTWKQKYEETMEYVKEVFCSRDKILALSNKYENEIDKNGILTRLNQFDLLRVVINDLDELLEEKEV